MSDPVLCEKCQSNPAQEPHTCPFGEEVEGDFTLCNCCEECEDECAMCI